MTKEEMEGPISFWGYKEQESKLILPEHDDDDDDLWLLIKSPVRNGLTLSSTVAIINHLL